MIMAGSLGTLRQQVLGASRTMWAPPPPPPSLVLPDVPMVAATWEL
jgi:hypothetical protein